METPNYYAVIPAEIRYSKELSMFQKLLYAEITALTQKDGYCWASNKYFAELYDVSERYISQSINSLKEKGFLQIFVDKEAGNKRKIYIGKITEGSGKVVQITKEQPMEQECDTPIEHLFHTYGTNVLDPYGTKVPHNNININNKNNNIKNITNSNELVIQKSSQKNQKNLPEKNKNTESISLLKNLSQSIDASEAIDFPEYAENAKQDFMDFLLYWTEPDKNGKIRAEKEKTFEIKRRFYLWMRRKKDFTPQKSTQQNEMPQYGGMYRKPGFDD